MRRVVLSGGPNPMDVRIRDSEDGRDITTLFTGLHLTSDGRTLTRASLTAFAELDGFEAEVIEPGDTPTALCAACRKELGIDDSVVQS